MRLDSRAGREEPQSRSPEEDGLLLFLSEECPSDVILGILPRTQWLERINLPVTRAGQVHLLCGSNSPSRWTRVQSEVVPALCGAGVSMPMGVSSNRNTTHPRWTNLRRGANNGTVNALPFLSWTGDKGIKLVCSPGAAGSGRGSADPSSRQGERSPHPPIPPPSVFCQGINFQFYCCSLWERQLWKAQIFSPTMDLSQWQLYLIAAVQPCLSGVPIPAVNRRTLERWQDTDRLYSRCIRGLERPNHTEVLTKETQGTFPFIGLLVRGRGRTMKLKILRSRTRSSRESPGCEGKGVRKNPMCQVVSPLCSHSPAESEILQWFYQC